MRRKSESDEQKNREQKRANETKVVFAGKLFLSKRDVCVCPYADVCVGRMKVVENVMTT